MKEETRNIAAPTILIILGATGDLMHRKLAPALYHLEGRGELPEKTRVVGFARRELSDDAFRDLVREFVGGFLDEHNPEMCSYLSMFSYQAGNFQDVEGYKKLSGALKKIDDEWGVCSNKLFYLAVPPKFYKEIFTHLADSGLTTPCSDETGWTRVLVEKPFGKDLKTAQELDELLGSLFNEKQIFRIDHYLAKEAVQNILAFRFSNSIFESSWDRYTIEKVEIKLLEEIGVEQRGAFYDGVGALRDVGQNHILQMLALIAMDRPDSFSADDIREKRVRLMEQLAPTPDHVMEERNIRGQYKGYGDEPGVQEGSDTETYFRLTVCVDNPRWQGVPFYLEGGKRLNKSAVEVIVTFKHIEPCLCPENEHYRNVLYFQLQPNQEISVSFWAKSPGLKMNIEEKALMFNYGGAFGDREFIGAYEKILLDCIAGDQTLFTSTDELVASWKFIDAILKGWKENDVPLIEYEPGSVGPPEDQGGVE